MMTDNVFSLVAGIGIGAAALYVLDPEKGARRRSVARDKMTETGRKIRSAAGVTTRDLGNRGAGLIAEARARFLEKDVSDEVLEGRVRSKLGFLVRHPAAITTQVSQGRVVLSGAVLFDEVRQLIDGLRAVRGVTEVDNNLTVHEDATRLPGLRGDKPRPAGEVWDIMQRRWSPSTRFLAGTAGAVSLGLIAYSLSDGTHPSRRHAFRRAKGRLGYRARGIEGLWKSATQ